MGNWGGAKGRGLGLVGLAVAVAACTQVRALPGAIAVAPGASPLPGAVVGGVEAPGASVGAAARAGLLAVLVRWGGGVQAPVTVRASLSAPQAAGGAVAQLEAAGADLAGQQAYFAFPALPGGAYRLAVTAVGAEGQNLGQLEQEVAVPPGDARRLDLDLALTPLPQPTPPRVSPNPRPDLAGASPGPTAGPPAVASPLPLPPTPVPSPPAPLPPLPPPPPGPPNFNALVAQGVALDVIGQAQGGLAAGKLEALLPADRGVLAEEVATASTALAQIMLVKAAVAGEQGPALRELGAALRGKAEPEVAALCLMRGAQDLVQQWQAACGPAVVQTLQGEANPLRALALHREPIHLVSPDLRCPQLALEQRKLLEAYGGVAKAREAVGVESPAIPAMLNDHAGPFTGRRYVLEGSTDLEAFGRLSALLKAGEDVPLRLGFGPQGGESWAHLVVALAVRGPTGAGEALVHDPFSGKTAWVKEGELRAGLSQPFFSEPARWTHLHRPSPVPGAWRLVGSAGLQPRAAWPGWGLLGGLAGGLALGAGPT